LKAKRKAPVRWANPRCYPGSC